MHRLEEWLVAMAVSGVIWLPPLVYLIRRKVQARRLGVRGIPSLFTWAFWLATCLVVFLLLYSSLYSFDCKCKVSEAKTNLGAIYTTQVSYFGENNTYADNFTVMNWEPEGQNLYTYYCGEDVFVNVKGDTVSYRPDGDWPFTIRPAVSRKAFTCFAIGNIDNDDFPDAWMITDKKKLVRVLDDEYNDDTSDFLAQPQNWRQHLRVQMEKILPTFLILAPPILLILSIIRDEVRWRRARKLKGDRR